MTAILIAAAASTAQAQHRPPVVSFGYSIAAYPGEEADVAPIGAYLSLASAGKYGIDFDIAYHRATYQSGIDYTLHTITVMAGPRYATPSGTSRPFAHLLIGVRSDMVEGVDRQSAGAMLGGGVDAAIGDHTYVRFGGDIGMFFDEGEHLEVVRLTAGLAFQ